MQLGCRRKTRLMKSNRGTMMRNFITVGLLARKTRSMKSQRGTMRKNIRAGLLATRTRVKTARGKRWGGIRQQFTF